VRTVRTKTRLRNSKDDRFYDDSTHDQEEGQDEDSVEGYDEEDYKR
jgi:hypothetical protein